MLISLFKKAVDFFLFTSLFIAVCAALMVHQTHQLFQLEYESGKYCWFVFFSTLASYNFHWYLTPYSIGEIERTAWSQRHKELHLTLSVLGLGGAIYHILYFSVHWPALGIAAVLTFLYSAPKIPHPFFSHLKKAATGKTFYLSFVWLYVTTILPLVFTKTMITNYELAFCFSRFFFIYAICIIFDRRDRENDRKEGIRSVITYLNERQVNYLFYFALFSFSVITVWLGFYKLPLPATCVLLIPAPILFYLYPKTKNNFSDYLYDFVLDGLLAVSSLITLFMSI